AFSVPFVGGQRCEIITDMTDPDSLELYQDGVYPLSRSRYCSISFSISLCLFDKRLPIPFMIGISGFLDDSLSLTMEGSLNKYPLSLSTSL
ncbi:MAG: hypothetical protein II042_04780, partial [Erysipelotrichaceae bacterium]|nr:hypothetical protein [Erysipelotrichaceae bacterium]